MIDIASGHPAIDRYLAGSYERVRGMSSRFAAVVCIDRTCCTPAIRCCGDGGLRLSGAPSGDAAPRRHRPLTPSPRLAEVE